MADVTGPTVTVERLSAGYGRADVLNDLRLEARPGTVTAVVGPNGAGKSTLFRVLMGFLRPRSGQVLMDGIPPSAFRGVGGSGFLPESPILPAGWTVSEWVEAAARLRGAPALLAAREAQDLLASLDMLDRSTRRLDRLSRGGTRMAGLAFALAGSPAAILLDEPLASLDVAARAAARNILRARADEGATVLVATHELGEVPRLADRVVLLAGGRISMGLDPSDPECLEARIVSAKGIS